MVNAVKKYLMPSSNSIFPAPWIKRPTTDPTQEEDVISLWFVCKLLLFFARKPKYGQPTQIVP